jgi:hypothetical protein
MFEGPRSQVRRPCQRARRAGSRGTRCARPDHSAAPCSSTSSPRRVAVTSPPSTTRPTSSTPIGVINPETGLPIQIAGRSWTDEFSDAMVRTRPRARGHCRDHRSDDDSGGAEGFCRCLPRSHLGRRHRRAACRDDGRRPGLHRPAPGRRDLCDLPQPGLRPGPHGLRTPQGGRHLRPRPLRCHRPPMALRITECGT